MKTEFIHIHFFQTSKFGRIDAKANDRGSLIAKPMTISGTANDISNDTTPFNRSLLSDRIESDHIIWLSSSRTSSMISRTTIKKVRTVQNQPSVTTRKLLLQLQYSVYDTSFSKEIV